MINSTKLNVHNQADKLRTSLLKAMSLNLRAAVCQVAVINRQEKGIKFILGYCLFASQISAGANRGKYHHKQEIFLHHFVLFFF